MLVVECITVLWVRLNELRKSGVFILLNITSVDLLRIFEEVQHAGDTLHILTSSDDLGLPDKTRHDFEYITNNFCRTPIPDRYFIVLQSFRNRYTMAYRAPSSASGADASRPRAQRLASLKRSLNRQCSRNLAAPLVDNDNASDSFYCIKDSPLLNNLFGQYVEESIYVKKSHDCSKFQMACLRCFKQAKLVANSSSHMIEKEGVENCGCQINCYNTPGCLGYYSPPCYPDDQQEPFENGTCVKGNTFKISLSPDYQNASSTFQCHLKRRPRHELQVNFTIQMGLAEVGEAASVMSPSSVLWKYELSLHYLRSIQRTKGMLQSDQSDSAQRQGDLKVKSVQVSRPFLYSTSNWRSAGCDLDIGNFLNEDEVLYGPTISSAIQLSRTEVTPVYLSIYAAVGEPLSSPLLHQDLLIFPTNGNHSRDVHSHSTYDFSIQLRFPRLSKFTEDKREKHQQQQGLRKLVISIQDCFQTQKVQFFMFTSEEPLETMMWDETLGGIVDEKGDHFEKLTKSFTNLSILSRVLSAKDANAVPYLQSEVPRRSFTCAKKGILVAYTSFRVFYTFIFTFSVALSILFSFWPPVGAGNSGSASTWNKGILLPLRQREAARRESDTEKLLNQHSAKAAQLVHACQDTLIRQIVDVAREVDRTVQEVLDVELNPQKSKENMFKMLESFVLRQMNDLDLSVQDYISHLRAELDSSMMPDVVRFSELLSSIYASQWLLFVKRMMNSTHIPWDITAPEVHFVPTPEHLNALRLKISNIEFARQFGLAEAENFLFIPSLITSQLEELVLSKVPSKTLQPNFVPSVYNESGSTTQGSVGQTFAAEQDVFKPLVLRSFTTLDDLEVINQGQAARASISTFPPLRPATKRRPSGGLFSLHLTPLSLGQLRLTLFLIDCYLIVTRFYNTYVSLREILGDPICGYHQHQQQSPTTFIRPIKSMQEVGGSGISPLHMTFAKTNQFIVILFGCATILFLAVLAISVNHRFLLSSKNAFSNDGIKAIDERDFYKHSETLIRDHRHVEDRFRAETCQIARLLAKPRWSGETLTLSSETSIPSVCSPPSMKPVDVENLFRQELCQFLPLKPSHLPQFLDRPIKQQYWQTTSASPITYLWRALASWIGGLSLASPLVVSHFLVIALCIAVVMFGLMGIFQSIGSLCHRLQQDGPALGEHCVHLLSAVPPPLERKFGPPPPRVFSVINRTSSSSPTPPSLSIDGVKIVDTATLVGDGGICNAQQYVLFSNSLQQSEATFVLSTERSPRFCPDNSEPAGV
ncbi:hypothetical protein EGR_04192 [Echinococcus granulosus]|uniref:Uncharacterized protein n=1 Tax=Echinococcus granulosus TaxID=6210 RepID=W6UIL8_ECHGR|nr:hypothetical protein EGR_04192 [Echinococcus granulosus]EUB60946.1 hypothetical protein EGR_04192 [Echinococcus granulosus]